MINGLLNKLNDLIDLEKLLSKNKLDKNIILNLKKMDFQIKKFHQF